MKKPSHRAHAPASRKRTRDEQKHLNKAREMARAKPLAWDDIEALYKRCCQMFGSTAPAIQILKNEDLRAALGDDIRRLTTMGDTLNRDAAMYYSQLENIHSKHAGNTGGSDDPTLMIAALQLGEEYRQWIFSFQTVVLTNVTEIIELAQEAVARHQTAMVNETAAEPIPVGEPDHA